MAIVGACFPTLKYRCSCRCLALQGTQILNSRIACRACPRLTLLRRKGASSRFVQSKIAILHRQDNPFRMNSSRKVGDLAIASRTAHSCSILFARSSPLIHCWPVCSSPARRGRWPDATPTSAGARWPVRSTCRKSSTIAAFSFCLGCKYATWPVTFCRWPRSNCLAIGSPSIT